MSLFGRTFDIEDDELSNRQNVSLEGLFGQTYNPNAKKTQVAPIAPSKPVTSTRISTVAPSQQVPVQQSQLINGNATISQRNPSVLEKIGSFFSDVKKGVLPGVGDSIIGKAGGNLSDKVWQKSYEKAEQKGQLPYGIPKVESRQFVPENFAQGAGKFIGQNIADLPLWIAGDAAIAKPLAALAKSKTAIKAADATPNIIRPLARTITPALETGVRAGATYGGVIAPLESAVRGDGLQGFIEREKQVPLMAAGGFALHGAGQLIGKGVKGAGNALAERRINKLIEPVEANPLKDFQSAYARPSIQDAKLANPISRSTQRGTELGPLKIRQRLTPEMKARRTEITDVFNNTPVGSVTTPVTRTTLQESIDNSLGISKQTGPYQGLDTFGKPLKSFKKSNDTQIAVDEITAKMNNQLKGIEKMVRQADEQTREGTIRKAIFDKGGIKQGNADIFEEQRVIPNWIRNNKTGRPLDEVADELGMTTDDLLKAINDSRFVPKDYTKEAMAIANQDKDYLALGNTLDTLKAELPGKAALQEGLTKSGIKLKPRELTPRPEPQPIQPQRTTLSGSLPVDTIRQARPLQPAVRERLTWTNREGIPISRQEAQLQPVQPLRSTEGPISPRDDGTIRPQVDRTKAKRRSFSEMIKEARTQFVEDVAPIEKMERSVTGGIASAENSIYKQARLFRGSPEQAAEFVRSKISPVMKKVEKQGKTVEDIGDYALAVHARDVNAKGIVSGFSDERIANTIAMHGTPEMEAARLELMRINNELLDSLAEGGVIEKSLVATLREKHPNYMPLFRSFEDEKIEFASGISNALANVSSPIQRLKGSERDVIDPIESMIKNVYKTISAVDRNKVASQLSGLADKDTSGKIVRRLAEGEEKSRLNAVFAMEGGKKVHYEVQPDVYKAIMGLDKESSLMLIKIFQQPASLLRAGATLTPEFSLRNPIRDVPAAFSVSNSGLNPVRDIPMALLDIIRSKRGKDTLYNQFLKDNAGYGNIISTDRKVLQDAMKDVLTKPDNKFVNVINPKSWLRVLRGIADISESATKLGEYRAALRSGASRPEAAYRARDIMDFGRAGASIREANKIVAFLNANIQGKSKIYRAIKENPIGVTSRAFASITVPTIGAFIAQKYLANDAQKQKIDDAPDWLTSTFWLLPVPGTDQVARVPKPFDLAPMFANLPERTLKYIFENDPEAFDGFARQTLASAALPQMLTALTPLIEGFSNFSLFRQAPVIPQREMGLNFPDQYDNRTTETAKFIAKGVDKLTEGKGAFKNFGSPRIIDNTIRGFTAGLGTYATSAIDFVAESTGLVDEKKKPARNVEELPLLRAFLVSNKSGGKSIDKLYSEKDALTRDKGSAKLTNRAFAQEDKLGRISSTTDEISDISKEIREIENNRNISPQSKRTRINTLTARRNLLAQKAANK